MCERRRWQVGVCSGVGLGVSGPSRRAAVTCLPQFSFFTGAHANLPSPTSCQAALVFLGHAMGGAVGLPACVKAKGAVNVAHWGRAVGSRDQGLLSFCCVTFYSARQADANLGSLAITVRKQQRVRSVSSTPP